MRVSVSVRYGEAREKGVYPTFEDGLQIVVGDSRVVGLLAGEILVEPFRHPLAAAKGLVEPALLSDDLGMARRQ